MVRMKGWSWYKPDANLTQTCAVPPKGKEVTGSNYLQQVIQHVYKHVCAISVHDIIQKQSNSEWLILTSHIEVYFHNFFSNLFQYGVFA